MFNLSNTIKKLSLLAVVLLLALSLGACKSQDKETKEEVKVESLNEKIAKAYSQVLDKADKYDYQDEGQEAREYEYAIVKMDGEKIPQLLLSKNSDLRYVKVFSYNEKEEKLIECSEAIVYGASGRSGFRGAILTRTDYNGLNYIMTLGGTGQTTLEKISIENGQLKYETKWEGRYDQMPEDDSTQEIVWSKINDKSQLEKLAGKEITPAGESTSKDNKQAKESDKELKSTAGSNKEKIQAMIREEEKADSSLASRIKNTDQVVRAKNTNMREDHSKNSAILKTLLSGTEVHVIDTYIESPERMWCKIKYEGVTGWISYNTINGSIK
jgi:bacterial SH3 domain protein